LIEMLYEGVLRFCSQAKRAIENNDIEKRVYWINRAINIFSELIVSLDAERGGEIAYYLEGLYGTLKMDDKVGIWFNEETQKTTIYFQRNDDVTEVSFSKI